MHILFSPQKTTFITSQPQLIDRNMGADEVMEIEKLITDASQKYIARALLQFDHVEISRSLSDRSVATSSITANLIIKSVETRGISSEYTIDFYPVSGAWDRGNGRKYDDNEYTYAGVSWEKRKDGVSGSWVTAGGDYYPISQSQTFTNNFSDIKIDISATVKMWISGELKNDGILARLSDETSSIDYGKIRFFSNNTNTIYKPYLDIFWNNATYNTGSFNATSSYIPLPESSESGQYIAFINNIKPKYSPLDEVKFEVFIRKQYVEKTFQRWPNYNYPYHDYFQKYLLPENSYFSIIDEVTNEKLIDFDDGTKISSTPSGSFFVCKMDFPIKRNYKILIKTTKNGIVNIYNNTESFRIE